MLKQSRSRRLVILVGVLVFAVIGYLVIHNSKAATSADIDNNGSVGISDLTILAANYGLSGKNFSQGDINGDTVVNIYDFSILAAQWGSTSGGQTYWDGNGLPFASNSVWNTTTPVGTQWFSSNTFLTSGGGARHWFLASTQVWYGKSTDPGWNFILPDYIYTAGNRNRPAQNFYGIKQPSNMISDQSDDHVLETVSGTNYYEVWNAIVDPTYKIVTQMPDYSQHNGNSSAISATSLTMNGQSWGTNSLVGQLLYVGGAFAQITSNTATQLNFSAWKLANGSTAPTPSASSWWALFNPGGFSSGVSGTNLTDTTKTGSNAWSVNNFNGHYIFSGGVYGKITSNTSNSVTISGWLKSTDGTSASAPAQGLPYFITGAPGWATGNVLTDPGAGTLGNNDGTRAANFSWIAGLITGYDIAQGKINHALAIALTFDTLDGACGGGNGGPGWKNGEATWIAPATSWEWGCWSGPIKMGSKLGIPSGTVKPSGLTTTGNMIFDTLQKYGAYVGDYAGGPWPVIYQDSNSVSSSYDWCTTFCAGKEFDTKILPLIKVADYQPSS